MSVEVSSVHTADALAMGTRSYAPAARGKSRSVSFALLSSMASTSSLLGGMATAVPAPYCHAKPLLTDTPTLQVFPLTPAATVIRLVCGT